MLTEENLMEARYEIVLLREKQDKLFNKLLKKIKKKHHERFEDLEHQLMDFCFNDIYYSGKDINNFIKELYSKEILLDN
jgi:bacterioferritin (cytochrome b1)